MKNNTFRNLTTGALGLCLGAVLVFSLWILKLSLQPHTTVTLLPLHEWFKSGPVMDGVSEVSITTVYGPVAVTQIHPR